MSNIVNPLFFQPSDINGIPLAGAKLFFYSTGTDTLATVYQDANLSTPHTNPVIADASGIFPTIYQGKLALKVRLETAAGVTIRTVDPFTNVEAIIAAILADTSKSYQTRAAIALAQIDPLVNFITADGYDIEGDCKRLPYKRVTVEPSHGGKVQSADGAHWELIESEPEITQFGVKYNSVANQSAVSQGFINYCAEKNLKGRVYGDVIAEGMVADKSVRLCGNDRFSHGFRTLALSTSILTCSADAANIMQDMAFIAPETATAAALVINATSTSLYGGPGHRVTDCYFVGGFLACDFKDGYSWEFSNNICLSQNTGPIKIANEEAPGIGRNRVVNNWMVGKGAAGARTSGTAINYTSGNDVWIENNWAFNFNAFINITLNNSSVFNFKINGNHGSDFNFAFYCDTTLGVLPSGVPAAASNFSMTGNSWQAQTCIFTTGPALTNGILSNNLLFPYVDGFGIDAVLNGVTVGGNHIDGTPTGLGASNTTGIRLKDQSYQTVVFGTEFSGVTAPYVIATTDPGVKILPGQYDLDNTVINVVPGASPWTYTAGPFFETFYIISSASMSVSLDGQALVAGQSANSLITVRLWPRAQVTFTSAGVFTARTSVEK